MILSISKRTVAFLSSYKLAYICLLFLLVLTFFGTLEQIDHGIYEVKEKYFHSLFLIHQVGGRFPIPSPGGGLLMAILLINLLVGGVRRIRKSRSKIGILVVHLGMVFLLVSGFITYFYAYEGHLTLYENQRSNEFQSYYDWDITISKFEKNGRQRRFVIPISQHRHLGDDQTAEFKGVNLPYSLRIDQYLQNCQPLPKGPMFEVDVPVIDGYFLKELPLNADAERNAPGVYVSIIDKQSSIHRQGLLWGHQRTPWVFEFGNEHWSISMKPKHWNLPFTIVLDKFTRELHPRTGMAKVFLSDVTKIENGVSQSLKISMNEPLRHKGFTLYQASWGPENAKHGQLLFSTFAVVHNPADKYPEYACYIIGFGLFLHFAQKLLRTLRLQQRRLL